MFTMQQTTKHSVWFNVWKANRLWMFNEYFVMNIEFLHPIAGVGILHWFQEFDDEGCICRRTNSGHPCVYEQNVVQSSGGWFYRNQLMLTHFGHACLQPFRASYLTCWKQCGMSYCTVPQSHFSAGAHIKHI